MDKTPARLVALVTLPGWLIMLLFSHMSSRSW